MLPQIVDNQQFLNNADLVWGIVIETPGDCPPAGKFIARMAKDPAGLDVDYIFSEARRNLIRGQSDLSAQTTEFAFHARASDISGFVGLYALDLLYVRGDETTPVMRTAFEFIEGV